MSLSEFKTNLERVNQICVRPVREFKPWGWFCGCWMKDGVGNWADEIRKQHEREGVSVGVSSWMYERVSGFDARFGTLGG